MLTDPIADMLTRIRNANSARKRQVRIKRNKVCMGIAQVLKDEGYITDYASIDDANQGEIRVDLKYGERGELVIQDIQRVSKPGCRVYRGSGELPRVLDGLGVAVVSTSQGVLSDRECRRRKVGGELLCTVC
ncbi:MAG: 30S ribosomal protein S8 [Phycisphaerales bacterium]|nr:30S ribosomal protein S8 [Phycisphaerales bacterium]